MICVRVIVVVPGQQQNPILLCGLRTIEKVVESTESPPPNVTIFRMLGLSASLLSIQVIHPIICGLLRCPRVRGNHAKIQSSRRTMKSRGTSPLLAASAMPALGAMPGA